MFALIICRIVHTLTYLEKEGIMQTEQRPHLFVNDLRTPYLYGNYLIRKPGWSLEEHLHPYMQVIFVTEGSLVLNTASKHFVLGQGEAVFLPGGMAHSLSSPPGYGEIGTGIDPEEVNHPLVRLLAQEFRQPTLFKAPLIQENLPWLIKHLSLPTPLSVLKVTHLMDQVFFSFFEDKGPTPFGERLTALLEAVENKKPVLEGICSKLSMSRSQLEKLCNREFGCGCIELYNRLRIGKACSLLLHSDAGMERIAEQLGFYDSAHFSRYFKSKTGKSPSCYRGRERK